MVSKVNGREPRIHPTAWVAPGAVVLGDVEMGPRSSVWYNAVVRGDINWIRIGARSNIQDGSIIHVKYKDNGTHLGDDVVVGHRVVLHSCRLADGVLIGNGAVVLDDAEVGEGSVVAAGAVVAPGKVIPPGVMAAGVPAKVVRQVGEAERLLREGITRRYVHMLDVHRDPDKQIDLIALEAPYER